MYMITKTALLWLIALVFESIPSAVKAHLAAGETPHTVIVMGCADPSYN
jgi:hypothetical protein